MSINSCPFCGGKGRVTAKEYKFGGWNGIGESRRQYQIRVMCNRCHAYGPCINSGWVKTTWSNWKNKRFVGVGDDAAFNWASTRAVELWNEAGKLMLEGYRRWCVAGCADFVNSVMGADSSKTSTESGSWKL